MANYKYNLSNSIDTNIWLRYAAESVVFWKKVFILVLIDIKYMNSETVDGINKILLSL